MSWSLTGIGKIVGVRLRFPFPVIDGFRLVFKDGSVKEIPYVAKEISDGWLYLFTPPIKLKGDEEASLQIHSSIPMQHLIYDLDLITETWEIDKVRFKIAGKTHEFKVEK